MTDVQKKFIELIKFTFFAAERSEETVFPEVVYLARKHGLSHLLGLKTADSYLAAMKSMQMDYVLGKVKSALTEVEIPFIPMKGALIRHMYPQPWMRSSSDIDILVKYEDIGPAVKALGDIGALTDNILCQHDIHLALSGISVELHYKLDYFEDKFLKQPWDFAEVFDGYEYRFTEGYFYYVFIAHTAKHFLSGGAGVRAMLDLQVVPRNHSIISNSKLEAFSIACERLSDKWFREVDVEVNECFEQMVLEGGLYSDRKQWAEIGQIRNGGKVNNVVHRLFASYDQLKDQYPVLKNNRFLLPYFNLKRIIDAYRRGMLKEHMKEVRYMNISDDRAEEVSEMLEELGL